MRRGTRFNLCIFLICGLDVTTCSGQLFGPVQELCVDCVLPIFADADADTDPDAWMVLGDTLVWVENESAAFTTIQVVHAVAPNSTIVRITDLDGDGDLDPILRDGASGMVTMLRKEGPEYVPEPLFEGGISIRVADIDEDGFSEILVREQEEYYRYLVCRILSTGSQMDTVTVVGSGAVMGLYEPFDWDGDGDPDVLSCQGLNCVLSVAYTVDGTLGSVFVVVSQAVGGGDGTSIVTDLNGDGALDMVAGINTYVAQGSGIYTVHGGLYGPVLAGAGNMDCDMVKELVGVSYGPEHTRMVILDLTLLGLTERLVDFAPVDDEYRFTIVDLDMDGRSDVVFIPVGDSTVHWRRNVAGEELEVILDLPESLPGDTVLQLAGGSPAGGYYEGQGVYDGVLWTQLSGEGPLEITYHYYDSISGCEAQASQVIIIEEATSTPEPGRERLSCWPVPVRDVLHVRFDPQGSAHLTLKDSSGRTLDVEGSTTNGVWTIDMRDRPDGLYILEVQYRERTLRAPVVVALH